MTLNSFIEESRFILEMMIAIYISSLLLYKRRDRFALKFLIGFALIYSISVFLFPFIKQPIIHTKNNFFIQFFHISWYITMSILVIVHSSLCFKMNYNESVFLLVIGYAIQHIDYCITNEMLFLEFFRDVPSLIYVLICLINTILIYTPFFVVLYKGKKNYEVLTRKDVITSVVLSIFFTLLEAVAFISQYIFNTSSYRTIRVVSIVLDLLFCIIIILSLIFIIKTQSYKKEKQFYTYLYENERKEYQLFKEKSSLINTKYHDIKHALNDLERRELITKDYSDKLKKNLYIDDILIDCGDEVLNTIISSKATNCTSEGIDLSLLVDGTLLKGYQIEDIYALLTNIFDNAIDYVKTLDKDKKYINFSIKRNDSYIVIKESNYLKELLRIDAEGFPISTKGDDVYHGYGYKSIRQFVKNNNGLIKIDQDNEEFRVTIMLPCLVTKE